MPFFSTRVCVGTPVPNNRWLNCCCGSKTTLTKYTGTCTVDWVCDPTIIRAELRYRGEKSGDVYEKNTILSTYKSGSVYWREHGFGYYQLWGSCLKGTPRTLLREVYVNGSPFGGDAYCFPAGCCGTWYAAGGFEISITINNPYRNGLPMGWAGSGEHITGSYQIGMGGEYEDSCPPPQTGAGVRYRDLEIDTGPWYSFTYTSTRTGLTYTPRYRTTGAWLSWSYQQGPIWQQRAPLLLTTIVEIEDAYEDFPRFDGKGTVFPTFATIPIRCWGYSEDSVTFGDGQKIKYASFELSPIL